MRKKGGRKASLRLDRKQRLLREANGLSLKSLSIMRKALELPLKKIDQVLEKYPRNIEALLLKGNTIDMLSAFVLQSHEDSRSCYEKVVRIAPANVCAHIDLGDWYYSEGQWRQAIDFYDKAISLLSQGKFDSSREEELEKAYMGKTWALVDANKLEAARKCAQKGLLHSPKSELLRSWSKPKHYRTLRKQLALQEKRYLRLLRR